MSPNYRAYAFTFFLTTFLFQNTHAQQFADKGYYLLDSLELTSFDEYDQQLLATELKIYHNAKSDTSAIRSLNRIVEGMGNPKWVDYNNVLLGRCKKALLKKDKLSAEEIFVLKENRANAINNLGYYYNSQGNSKLGLRYYQRALTLYTEIQDTTGIMLALGNVAYIHEAMGDIFTATEYDEKRMKLATAVGDTVQLSDIYNSIGFSLLSQEFYLEAIVHFKKSLELATKIDLHGTMAIAHNNLGFCYSDIGQDSLAMVHYMKALRLKEEHTSYKAAIVPTLANIASLLKMQIDSLIEQGIDPQLLIDSTERVLFKALRYARESKELASFITPYNSLSHLYIRTGDLQRALAYSDSAYAIASEGNYQSEIAESAEARFDALYCMGRYREALEMHILWRDMDELVRNREKAEQAISSNYQISFETRTAADSVKFAEERKLAVKEIELRNIQIEADRKQRWFLVIGLILLGVFGAMMYNRFRLTRRQKSQIEEQKSHIEEVHKEITDSINYAKRLQSAILPSREQLIENTRDGFVLFLPKDVVSGDFYWMQVSNDLLFLAAADCTGHGVPGAMVSVVCSNALNRGVKEFGIIEPAKLLDTTRDLVIETFARSGTSVRDGMDVAVCAIDQMRMKLKFAGANNPLWLIRKGNSELPDDFAEGDYFLREYKGDKQPIGLYDGAKPFSQKEVQLQADDRIYLFTDGFADQFGGEKGKKLKYKNLKLLLLRTISAKMDDQQIAVTHGFHQWRRDFEQIDDICIIGVKI